jgi:hypothetical protein
MVFLGGAALAGLVVAELAVPSTPLPGLPASRPVEAPSPAPSLSAPPVDDPALAATMLTRPLFSATRRPVPLGGDPAPAATAQATPPRLAGTVITGLHNRVALLAVASAEKLLVVREGDTVGAYRIVQIGAGEVVAESPGGPVTLRMGQTQAAQEPARDVASDAGRRATGAPDQDE